MGRNKRWLLRIRLGSTHELLYEDYCRNTFCCAYRYLTYFKNSKLALFPVFRKRELGTQRNQLFPMIHHSHLQNLRQCDKMRPAFHGRGWTEPVGTGLHRLVTRSPQLLFKPSVINDYSVDTHSREGPLPICLRNAR